MKRKDSSEFDGVLVVGEHRIPATVRNGRIRLRERPVFPSQAQQQQAAELAEQVIQGVIQGMVKTGQARRSASDLLPLSDDAFVDQYDRRVPKDWFVRAAKAGRFPCVKEGRRYIAQWADVKAALPFERMPHPEKKKTGPRSALRDRLGLKEKG